MASIAVSFPNTSNVSREPDTLCDQNVSRVSDALRDQNATKEPSTLSDQNVSKIPQAPETLSDRNVSKVPQAPETLSDQNVSKVSQVPETLSDQSVSKVPSALIEEWKTLHRLFPQSSLCIENSRFEECTVVVPLSLDAKDFVFSFSLTSDYPFEVPYICLNSSVLSKSEMNDIMELMELMCAGSIGHPMLISCIEEAVKLLQRRDDHQKFKGKKNRNHKKQRKKKPDQLFNATVEKNESNCDSNDDNSLSKDIISNPVDLVTHEIENIKLDEHCSAIDSKSLRPNYFIAIRIQDKILIDNLVTIQNTLVEKETLLTKGVIPMSALHLTLCNLGLDSADDLVRAMEALRKMKADLQNVLPTSPLIIHGASQFYDRAIYANVKTNEEFLAFRDSLIRKLVVAGVAFREDHEQYKPHVTLIKVRRPERRMFGNRPINPTIYSSFLECVHGEQIIDAIYLCAMDGNKREDGFYITPYELQFETGH